MSARHTVIAALLASAAITRGPLAHATPPPVPPPLAGSPLAAGLGAAGTLASTIAVFTILFKDVRDNPRAAMVVMYVGGALGLGLGAVGLGVQGAHPGRCDSTCVAAHGLGAASVSVGALDVLFGALYNIDVAKGRRASFAPVPLLLQTEHGRAFGVGLAGTAF